MAGVDDGLSLEHSLEHSLEQVHVLMGPRAYVGKHTEHFRAVKYWLIRLHKYHVMVTTYKVSWPTPHRRVVDFT